MATKLLIGAAAMVVALAQDSLGASEVSVTDRSRRLGTRHGEDDALTPELVPHDGKERRRFRIVYAKMLEEMAQEAKKREERARQRAVELAAKITGSIGSFSLGSAFGIRDGGRRRIFFNALRSIIDSLQEKVERLKESKMQSGFMQKAADQLADKIDEMRNLFQRLGYDDGVSKLFELKAQLLTLIGGGRRLEADANSLPAPGPEI